MKTIELDFSLPKVRKWIGNYTTIRETDESGKQTIKFCDYYVDDEGNRFPYKDKVFAIVVGEFKEPSDAWKGFGGNHFLVEKISFPSECENPYELFTDIFTELQYYEKHKEEPISTEEYWENMRKYACANIYFYADCTKMIDTKGYFWYNMRYDEVDYSTHIAYCHFVLKDLRDKYADNKYYDFGASKEKFWE